MSQENTVNINLRHLNQFVEVGCWFCGQTAKVVAVRKYSFFPSLSSISRCLSLTKTLGSNKGFLILAVILQNIQGLHIIDCEYSMSKQGINNNLLAWFYLDVLNYKENSFGFFLKSSGSQIACLKVEREQPDKGKETT